MSRKSSSLAMYECVDCHYPRVYGFAAPPDEKERVKINCFSCSKVTEHCFVKVERAWAEAESFQ